MPKPKPTDEQKRAKAVRKAKWEVVTSSLLFVLCVALLYLFISDRYSARPMFSVYDVGFLCGGFLYSAFSFADAKHTIRTDGDKRNSLGGVLALLLFLGSHYGGQIARYDHSHGTHLGLLCSYILGTWLLVAVPTTVWFMFWLRRVRAARRGVENPTA